MVRRLSGTVLDPIRSRGATWFRGRSTSRSKLDRSASHRHGERDHDFVRRRGESIRSRPAAWSTATSGYGSEPRPAAETRPPVRTGSGIDPASGSQWRPTGEWQSEATVIRGLPQKLRRNMRGRNQLPRTPRKTGQPKETLPMTTTVPPDITCASGRGSTYGRTLFTASLAPRVGRLPFGRRKLILSFIRLRTVASSGIIFLGPSMGWPHMLYGSRRRLGIVSWDAFVVLHWCGWQRSTLALRRAA